MRWILLALLALGVWLVPAGFVQAGLYNTESPLFRTFPANHQQFQAQLSDLRSVIRIDPPSQVRVSFLKRVAELEAKGHDGTLTVEDRVNLSCYYILLSNAAQPRFEEATRVLEAVPQEDRNFMVLGNLATAHQMADRGERAESYLLQSLRNFPVVWLGWTSRQLLWFNRVERYHLTLVQARMRDSRQPALRELGVDNLFPGLRFVGPSGEYEAGALAADQWARLPQDAMNLVTQLVLWLPHDDRLYWLLAELINAGGDFVMAADYLDELVTKRGYTASRELKQHRIILREAARLAATLKNARDWILEKQSDGPIPLVEAMLPYGVGPLLDTIALVSALDRAMKETPPEKPPVAEPAPPAAGPPAISWSLNWPQIGVSFAAGIVLTLLFSWQLRESRRRR